jgi:hypothetical protein
LTKFQNGGRKKEARSHRDAGTVDNTFPIKNKYKSFPLQGGATDTKQTLQ